jgi:hypothetical protein
MALHVCHGATLECSLGTAPSTMTVLPLHRMLTNGEPAANIGDHVPLLNILPFGVCQLTRLPCVPATPAPWVAGAPSAILDKLPLLNDSSILNCVLGGVIEVVDADQSTELVP